MGWGWMAKALVFHISTLVNTGRDLCYTSRHWPKPVLLVTRCERGLCREDRGAIEHDASVPTRVILGPLFGSL